ncbi:hypothetical protein NX059_009654 [Plenodomus lindquistii]|nr:hypothetical protein NX059_009654 [Plenodomus lindquistii]
MAASNAHTPTPASVPAFFPNPVYLFSATVNLGKTFGPIPLIEGGVRVVETIVGGSIYGPGFNATIEGGADAPILVDNGDGCLRIFDKLDNVPRLQRLHQSRF